MCEGKSNGRQSKAISSGTADAQGFALYALGKEKLELAEEIWRQQYQLGLLTKSRPRDEDLK